MGKEKDLVSGLEGDWVLVEVCQIRDSQVYSPRLSLQPLGAFLAGCQLSLLCCAVQLHGKWCPLTRALNSEVLELTSAHG